MDCKCLRSPSRSSIAVADRVGETVVPGVEAGRGVEERRPAASNRSVPPAGCEKLAIVSVSVYFRAYHWPGH